MYDSHPFSQALSVALAMNDIYKVTVALVTY